MMLAIGTGRTPLLSQIIPLEAHARGPRRITSPPLRASPAWTCSVRVYRWSSRRSAVLCHVRAPRQGNREDSSLAGSTPTAGSSTTIGRTSCSASTAASGATAYRRYAPPSPLATATFASRLSTITTNARLTPSASPRKTRMFPVTWHSPTADSSFALFLFSINCAGYCTYSFL